MSETEQSDPQTFAIIGSAMSVHSELGDGFLERVYQEALCVEFARNDVQFVKEVDLPITYKGTRLDCGYRADFICYGEIVVELKVAAALDKSHMSQVINYLKATGYRRGLLLNFGSSRLEYKRIAN